MTDKDLADLTANSIYNQAMAEIQAIFDGAEYCTLLSYDAGRTLQGWRAWSFYAGTGEWA
jgi:hypothetical protein